MSIAHAAMSLLDEDVCSKYSRTVEEVLQCRRYQLAASGITSEKVNGRRVHPE